MNSIHLYIDHIWRVVWLIHETAKVTVYAVKFRKSNPLDLYDLSYRARSLKLYIDLMHLAYCVINTCDFLGWDHLTEEGYFPPAWQNAMVWCMYDLFRLCHTPHIQMAIIYFQKNIFHHSNVVLIVVTKKWF